MNENDLLWLAVQARTRERIADVGARYTKILAEATSGVVWVVDSWNGDAEHDDPEWAAMQFYTVMREHIDSRKVHASRMDPAVFAAEWLALGRVPFDMTFIDAGPNSPFVEAWKPITRGLLCGYNDASGLWTVNV